MKALGLSQRARDLLVLATLALALRLAWALVFGRTSTGPNDTLFYQSAAYSLASGRGFATLFGEPTAHWPPGFPFLVSLAYRVFGNHPTLALAINVVLSTATVVLLYLVAERMFGRRGARAAGAALAILPGPIFFTGLWLTETTYIFMLVGFFALALFLPDRRWTPLVLGVAVGLAALTKGEGILLAVVPMAMWWGRYPRRLAARRTAALLAAALLTVLPWTIRNAIVLDAFIPVSTNASTTLWSGHNAKANGGPTYAPPELLMRIPRDLPPPEHEVAEARLLRREAVRWATHNPAKELGLIPRKLLALNNPTSTVFATWPNAGGERQVRTSSLIVFGVLGDALGYFLLFVVLASLVIIGPRRLLNVHPGMRGVMAYLGLCLVVYGFVYYGQFRYRIPMEPLMILLATPLLVRVWEQRVSLRDAKLQHAPDGDTNAT